MAHFVDTNILVYAEDRDAGSKHVIARDLLADLWRSGQGVLSVQVLQEFFVTVTRKVPRPLGSDDYLSRARFGTNGLYSTDRFFAC